MGILNKPILVIHNGNTSVLDRLDLPQDTANYSCADISPSDLYTIRDRYTIVKAITSYLDDCANLDACWNDYTVDQYIECLSFGLALADRVEHLDPVDVQFPSNQQNISFNPGRCGGAKLLNHLDSSYTILHHNRARDPNFVADCIGARDLKTVMRRSLFTQCASRFMEQVIGELLPSHEQYREQNLAKIAQAQPKPMRKLYCKNVLLHMINFVDYYYLFTLVFKKPIDFYFSEDIPQMKGNWQPHPYRKQDLITNYDEIKAWVEQELQPQYMKLFAKKG